MAVLAIVGGSLTFIYKQYRRYEAENRDLPYSSTVLPVTYAMSSAMVGTFVSPTYLPTYLPASTLLLCVSVLSLCALFVPSSFLIDTYTNTASPSN